MTAFDPHPNIWDLIALQEERDRTRPPGTPIRVIRAVALKTTAWRADGRFSRGERTVSFASGRTAVFRSREAERCEALAETGDRLGLERVGLVVEVTP